jgi:hypothetical protein
MAETLDPGCLGHWPAVAHCWQHVGPPLRPCAEDLSFLISAINRWSRTGGPPRSLVLGVTCEYYGLPWPPATDLLAVDHAQVMIDEVWPGPPGTALCADWTTMPLPPASRDIVLTDGGLSLLAFPAGHRILAGKLREIVAPGGLCLFRLYLPPARRETTAQVLDDLSAGKISNLSILKFRLWMAVQDDPGEGVELRHIWDLVHRAAPVPETFAERIGWPAEHLRAIDTYRDCPARYYFPFLPDLQRIFCDEPGGFTVEEVLTPSHSVGSQCPTLVLRRE